MIPIISQINNHSHNCTLTLIPHTIQPPIIQQILLEHTTKTNQ